MLFRPSFCCNCGEKIERAEWKLWTSRRFCELCATDFTLHEILPRAIVAVAAVVVISGTVNYFALGPSKQNIAAAKAFDRPQVQNTVAEKEIANSVPSSPAVRPAPANVVEAPAKPPAAVRPVNPNTSAIAETGGPVYMCGAETKKGTPCSRKVKGNVRCWQHMGQPAMLPPEKLLVSR